MKNSDTNTIRKVFLIPVLMFCMLACTHDNEVTGGIEPPDYNYGDDVVSFADGYGFDQNHSSVRWETLYLGTSALLTGRFNEFNVESFTFKADEPENIEFEGVVVLSTVNTGEPGRDQGCLQGTLGTADNDTARIVSKSVSFDDKGGYIVTCDFEFHGYTHEVLMQLNFSGLTRFDENSGLNGAPFTVGGFAGSFEFNALTDYGIESHNIADRVAVLCNMQFKKPG